MKKLEIEVTDEMYEFLMDLSKELNSQDHRCTAMPYFFQVQTDEKAIGADGIDESYEVWVGNDTILRDEEDIKQAVFELRDWDGDNVVHEQLYSKLDEYEIEDILEEEYTKHFERDVQVYKNAFLTAKACKKHIEANRHHYNNPQDYLTHAFRNPELEKVFEFLCSLSGGEIHK